MLDPHRYHTKLAQLQEVFRALKDHINLDKAASSMHNGRRHR